jgi:hypothetical protein
VKSALLKKSAIVLESWNSSLFISRTILASSVLLLYPRSFNCFHINQSITTGVVPQSMKYARVKPLFKKNSPLEVGNNRPISILNIVSKILERSVCKQLVEFLQEDNMLYHLQSGFRQKYSTDTSLI